MMARAVYPDALKHVLVHEGGYVNHPDDPGGETNRGVTKAVYDGYRRRVGKPVQSVRYISDQEVEEIYRVQYWNRVRADELPRGVDYVVFDGAVNSGPTQSIKWLQRALGVQVDGMMGEATMGALDLVSDHDALIADICARRMAFLQQLRTWGTFGKGWTSRVSGVKKAGQAWAAGSVGPMPVHVEGAGAKAKPDQIAKPVTQNNIGVTTMTAAPVVEVANQLNMFASASQIITYIVVGLFLVGAAIKLYAMWRNSKVAAVESADATAEVPDFEEIEP
jgi:lysozyme family protein